MSPLYIALIVADPAVRAVKVEVHVAVPAIVPAVKLHGFGLIAPPVNETVPVGVVGLAEVSVTTAVHAVAWVTTIVDGEHEMTVVVGSSVV